MCRCLKTLSVQLVQCFVLTVGHQLKDNNVPNPQENEAGVNLTTSTSVWPYWANTVIHVGSSEQSDVTRNEKYQRVVCIHNPHSKWCKQVGKAAVQVDITLEGKTDSCW